MGLTATFFWRVFEETGSIRAYLAYKHFFKVKKQQNKENYI
ncbi:MAG: YqzL family protein [Bacillota bacterium]